MNQSYSLPQKSFNLVLDGLWVNVVLKGGGCPQIGLFLDSLTAGRMHRSTCLSKKERYTMQLDVPDIE
jgi:hypothetical protein